MQGAPFPFHPTISESEAGPWRKGTVIAHIPENEQFLIAEDGNTGYQVSASRAWVDPGVYSQLYVGAHVEFRVTIGRATRLLALSMI